MTERFVRVQPEMSLFEVMNHLRRIDSEVGSITDLYVLDADGSPVA
jgi:Mg/Co/Ni transporter MgtE